MRHKSLQELEGEDWGDPKHTTHMIVKCHQLRRVPLKDLTIEDLRLLIGQHIGLKYLMPLALEALTLNPLAEGDYYEGDLLKNVIHVPEEFWQSHPQWKSTLETIIQKAWLQIEAGEGEWMFEADRLWLQQNAIAIAARQP